MYPMPPIKAKVSSGVGGSTRYCYICDCSKGCKRSGGFGRDTAPSRNTGVSDEPHSDPEEREIERRQILPGIPPVCLERSGDLFALKDFNDIAFADVVVTFKGHPAFLTGLHFGYFVFEPFEGF